MDQLQQNILHWTKLDKELKEVNKVASDIRKKKEDLQSQVCPLIKEHQLTDNVFSIPSLQTNVSLKEHKVSESMSYKFLEEKFTDYFDTPEQCATLLSYLKEHRKKESTFVLKSSEIKESNEW